MKCVSVLCEHILSLCKPLLSVHAPVASLPLPRLTVAWAARRDCRGASTVLWQGVRVLADVTQPP